MIKNYDQSNEINHNPNWSYIPDHPNTISIIGGWGSGKTNVLLNLIKKSTTKYWKDLLICQRSIKTEGKK